MRGKLVVISILITIGILSLYLSSPAAFDKQEQVETKHKLKPKNIDDIIKIPADCEPVPFPGDNKVDPFWKDIAFVIRTGKNVAEERFISGHLTWHSRVSNVIYVSDEETEPYTYVWRGRNISMPKMWDGVNPYAPEGDISIDSNPWYKDFVKHLGALQILYTQLPNMTYYIMADDDTYFFLEHLKEILQQPQWEPRLSNVLLALCYPIDFNFPLHSCDGKFPPNSYFTAGGAGIVMSKKTMDTMFPNFPHCYEAYKTCWAGDRRLGACLMDSGITWCNRSTFNGRDLVQTFSGKSNSHVTSLHKMSNKQFLLLDWIERMANPPGWVYDDYLMGYWEFLNNNTHW